MMRGIALFAAVAPAFATAARGGSVIVGNVRVSALSPTLIRVEEKGPTGWEDRPTMNVVGRDEFTPLELKTLNTSAAGTWLATGLFHVFVPSSSPPPPTAACGDVQHGTDGSSPTRSPAYPNGTHAASPGACCALCKADAHCQTWVAAPLGHVNCWPLRGVEATVPHPDRTFGRVRGFPAGLNKGVIVATPSGKVLYSGANTGNGSSVAANLLHWPSPLDSTAYAFTDFPRFTVPAWGPTPIPAGSKVPAHLVATNGYE